MLTNDIDLWLSDLDFFQSKSLLSGNLYINKKSNISVIIDIDICNNDNPFSYEEYTKEQNDLIFSSNQVYRFLIDNKDDLDYAKAQLCGFIKKDFSEYVPSRSRGMDREHEAIDPSVPEAYFEQVFSDVYGRDKLNMIYREYPILDINGSTRWIDYVIFSNNGMVAIEKNGVRYHHPLIIGVKRYKDQLVKQNSIIAQGAKLYRWSLENMQFKDVFCEEIKAYLPQKEDIVETHHILAKRKFKLFNHQKDVLKNIQNDRLNGNNTFLVVLPTGTGKTHIIVSDYTKQYREKSSCKMMVLVPSRKLKAQWIQYFKEKHISEGYSDNIGDSDSCDIMVQTYSWMSRYYHTYSSDVFDYIVIDEAHHAVAPTLKKIIQSFNPQTLIGLTATPERLDTKKLESIFGEYETNFTLKEAIEKEILSPIKAFRIKSNLDLSEIRYNGKDYVSTDLQKNVVVPSRDQLIVDVLKKYFVGSDIPFKSGLVFCVSVNHAESIAKRMREHGISAEAVSGKNKRSFEYINEYENGEIQFLCTCSLITEGWDSPRTSIIVMARPTMSKVLYLQQLGRGTRKYPGKEALYVIDVVDNYGPLNAPWSCHAIFGMSNYLAWANVLNVKQSVPNPGNEEIILAGLYEKERKIEKLNIFTFEEEYPDHLSIEQLARELFVSTGTVKNWIKKQEIIPDVSIPFWRHDLHYFNPSLVEKIRSIKNLKLHDEGTQYDDFFEFLEKGDYSFSYKIIFLLSFLKLMDHNGECNLDKLVEQYSKFYKIRHELGIQVDKGNSPYNELKFLDDSISMKRSLLSNPFEKFERKRFMYHCKDLNNIAFSFSLWNRINSENDLRKIRMKMLTDLEDYFKELSGVPNIKDIKDNW